MFEIGQIVYVLFNEEAKILPAIIQEEIIRKTIRGQEVNYLILVKEQEERLVQSDKIDGQIFGSLPDLKREMMSKFELFVDNLCKNFSSNQPLIQTEEIPEKQKEVITAEQTKPLSKKAQMKKKMMEEMSGENE